MRPPMARQPAGPDASRPALLRLVLGDLVGETLGLLQDLSIGGPARKRARSVSSLMPSASPWMILAASPKAVRACTGSPPASYSLPNAAWTCQRSPGKPRSTAIWAASRKWPMACSLCPSHAAKTRSEEHTSELQSQSNLVCRLLLEKKK